MGNKNDKEICQQEFITHNETKIPIHYSYRLFFQAKLVRKFKTETIEDEKEYYDFPEHTDYKNNRIYPLDTFIHYLSPYHSTKKFSVVSNDNYTYIFDNVKIGDISRPIQPLYCCCDFNQNHFEIDWYIKGISDKIQTVSFTEIKDI